MTTTNVYMGMETVAKPTSRVLAPPGGKANFSLGDGHDEDAPPARKPSSGDRETEKMQTQVQKDLYKPSPPQPIRPAVGNNPLTGEPNLDGTESVPVAPQGGGGGGGGVGVKGRAKPVKLDPASMPAAGGRVDTKAAMKRQPPGGAGSGIF